MSKKQKYNNYNNNYNNLPEGITDEDILLLQKMQITQFPKAPSLKKENDINLYLKRLKQICSEKVYDKKTREAKIRKITTLFNNYVLYQVYKLKTNTTYNNTYNTLDINNPILFTLKIYDILKNKILDLTNNIYYCKDTTKRLIQLNNLNIFSKWYINYLITNTAEHKVVSGTQSVFGMSVTPDEFVNLLKIINNELFVRYLKNKKITENKFKQNFSPFDYKGAILFFLNRPETVIRADTQGLFKLLQLIRKYFIVENNLLMLSKKNLNDILYQITNTFPNLVCDLLFI